MRIERIQGLVAIAFSALCLDCSSTTNDPARGVGGAAGASGSSGDPACPTLFGSWVIASHCVQSFVGDTVTITQDACKLSMAEPFDGYTGTVEDDGALAVSGPSASGTQECTGTSSPDAIVLACPGPCAVELSR